jgi:aspartate/methionine/tyrosine aminotransferase
MDRFISMARSTVLHSVRCVNSASITPAARCKKVLEGGNIFATFTALSNEHKAMNLGQGFPSFGAPPFLANALAEVCKGDAFSVNGPLNLNNQYTKPGEEPTLALTLSKMYRERFQKDLNASNVCTFVGAQEGIFTTMATFCNPGDEMVIITPCFDAYFKSASVFGLDVKGVPLTLRNEK